MKEKINVFDYAETINKELKPGYLLNTYADKFNSMVIGWGSLGIIWGIETFTCYVRDSRFTKEQIDKTGKFTISIPLGTKMNPEIFKICGSLSGRDTDKEKLFTLEDPIKNNVPGVKECPLTIECEVIYSHKEDISLLPKDIQDHYYSNGDPHTLYVGKILEAYIIK